MKDFLQVETADNANLKKNKGIEGFLYRKNFLPPIKYEAC